LSYTCIATTLFAIGGVKDIYAKVMTGYRCMDVDKIEVMNNY